MFVFAKLFKLSDFLRKCFPHGLLGIYKCSTKNYVKWLDITVAILLALTFLVISLYDMSINQLFECGVIQVGELVVGYEECNVFV